MTVCSLVLVVCSHPRPPARPRTAATTCSVLFDSFVLLAAERAAKVYAYRPRLPRVWYLVP